MSKRYYYKVWRTVKAETLEEHLNSHGRNGQRVISVAPNVDGTYTTVIESWLDGTHTHLQMGTIPV